MLLVLFVLFNMADLALTLLALRLTGGEGESMPAAQWAYQWGEPGLVALKAAGTALIVALALRFWGNRAWHLFMVGGTTFFAGLVLWNYAQLMSL